MSRFVLAQSLAILLCSAALRAAEPSEAKREWGDLTGRIIFDGVPPKPIELRVDKDKEVVKGPILSESLVVDAKNRGLSNVFVWLVPDPDKPPVEHPDYSKAKTEPAIIQMKGLRFQPHCVVFRTGQTLKILQKDPKGHNPRFNSLNNPEYSTLIPAGGPIDKVMKNSEPAPLPISCNIHPWMSGYFLCRDNPYMALTSPTGEFTLKNLPVGKHSFRIWHEEGGLLTKARRNGEKQEWKKGRIELEIRPGRNDLGDVLVPAASLQRK